MAEYKCSEYYFHSCDAARSAEERLTRPLHYYLHRGDIIAFRRELRQGTSPFVKDAFGNSVLDSVIGSVEQLLVTGICTSFPIDDLLSSIRTEALLPAKFCQSDPDELYAGLYTQQEAALYKSFAKGNPEIVKPIHPEDRFRLLPKQHQGYPERHPTLPPAPTTIGTKAGPFKDARSTGQQPEEAANDSLANPENAVLVALADCFSKPLSNKIRVRLQRMIRKLRVYQGLLTELSSSDALLEESLKKLTDKQALLTMHSSTKKMGGVVLEDLTIPYLYVTCIRLMLEMYPSAPDGVPWKSTSPIDIRVMCGMVCRLELTGHYVLLFLAEYAQGLAKFLLALFRPPFLGGEMGDLMRLFRPRKACIQYMLHMAFVLDVPELFDCLVHMCSYAKATKGPFDWQGTLEELKKGERSPAIDRYIQLLNRSLGKDEIDDKADVT